MIGDLDFFNQERERSHSSLTQLKERTLSDAVDRSTNISSHHTDGGSFKLRLIPTLAPEEPALAKAKSTSVG